MTPYEQGYAQTMEKLGISAELIRSVVRKQPAVARISKMLQRGHFPNVKGKPFARHGEFFDKLRTKYPRTASRYYGDQTKEYFKKLGAIITVADPLFDKVFDALYHKKKKNTLGRKDLRTAVSGLRKRRGRGLLPSERDLMRRRLLSLPPPPLKPTKAPQRTSTPKPTKAPQRTSTPKTRTPKAKGKWGVPFALAGTGAGLLGLNTFLN